ncbi:hypothetical protein HX864_10205 [Pseudomonas yamanorum]|uniref:hypothetical protein n=1 Tax=Pseudomonas yamanorum TaxID=515393 RepID=UPI0015A317DB|nr:hypothetical protein [Pseudomonas yamanorum]NWD23630.1 hypothetical protein [Pseudomonas yamanorum]
MILKALKNILCRSTHKTSNPSNKVPQVPSTPLKSSTPPLNQSKNPIFSAVAQAWLNAGVTVSILPKNLKLYSGQTSKTINAFDYDHNMDIRNQGMWLTESIFYAKSYCYHRVTTGTVGQLLFKIQPSSDLKVLEFPPDYHPAAPITNMIDGLTPDIYISKHWNHFLSALTQLNADFSDSKGHVRKSATSSLGLTPTDLIEVWIYDKTDLKQINVLKVPKTSLEFKKIYGDDPKKITDSIFI